MAVGYIDVSPAFGREHRAEIVQQPVSELHHGVGIDVQRRAMHRSQHFVWHGGRAGDSEKLTTCANDHFLSLLNLLAIVAWHGAESKLRRPQCVDVGPITFATARKIWSLISVAAGLGIVSGGSLRLAQPTTRRWIQISPSV